MSKKAIFIPLVISTLSVATSFLAESVFHAIPCLLCLIQRGCWIATFLASLSGLILSQKKVGVFSAVFLSLARLGLLLAIFFGLCHGAIHQGWIRDFCVRSSHDFATSSEYVRYLAKHPPCGEGVATLFGVPAYVLSVCFALGAFIATFPFRKNLKKHKQYPLQGELS